MERAMYKTICIVLMIITYTAHSQNQGNINGQILYHGLYPLPDITASLSNLNGDLIASTVTNNNGVYNFNGIPDGDYTVHFTTSQPVQGVNLIDVYIVMLHLMDLYPFSPIQHLAADVDGSGSITWNDYILILISYLNQGNTFPVGDWVFEPVFVSPGSRSGVTSNSSSSGDINGTYLPTKSTEISPDVNTVEQELYASNEGVIFELYTENNLDITGFHFIFQIMPGMIITDIQSPLENLNYTIHGQELRVTWMDATLNGSVSDSRIPLLSISSRNLSSRTEASETDLQVKAGSHFINPQGELLSGVTLMMKKITIKSPDQFSLAAYPNPFFDHATISYELPCDGKVTITLYDQSAKFIREIENTFLPAGSYQAVVEGVNLQPGVYYYKFDFTGNISINKTGSFIKPK